MKPRPLLPGSVFGGGLSALALDVVCGLLVLVWNRAHVILYGHVLPLDVFLALLLLRRGLLSAWQRVEGAGDRALVHLILRCESASLLLFAILLLHLAPRALSARHVSIRVFIGITVVFPFVQSLEEVKVVFVVEAGDIVESIGVECSIDLLNEDWIVELLAVLVEDLKCLDVEALPLFIFRSLLVLRVVEPCSTVVVHRPHLCLWIVPRVDTVDTFGGQIVMRWHIIVHLLPRLHQQVLLIINEYEIGEELDGLGLEQSSEGSILQIAWIERDTLLIFSCHSLSDLRADEAVLNVYISELVVLNLPLLFDQVGLGVLVAVIQVDLGWLLRDVLLPELRLLILQVWDDDELVVLWLSQDALFRVL